MASVDVISKMKRGSFSNEAMARPYPVFVAPKRSSANSKIINATNVPEMKSQ
jgi:hypothetical protein